MPSLVVEIGTEEMPAGSAPSALAQFAEAVSSRLTDARIPAESVEALGTPRRLILRAVGVPDRQPDAETIVRGPSASIAFDSTGAATGAAVGFARKQGVVPSDLERISTAQGDYVQARVALAGKPSAEVIGPIVEESVRALTFPKMMRWGTGAMRYVRPIRWIVALLDDETVPLEIGSVRSGRLSRGHRYLSPAEFEVNGADSLLSQLEGAGVISNPESRRSMIREQCDALAASAGGRIPWDDALLDENTWLVEYPTALVGRFNPEYLQLPRAVLVTAMKKHQRFFPIEDSRGELLPLFVSIRNGGSDSLDLVRAGNERVLTARFADAHYFFRQDREVPLDEMARSLGRLVFQDKLGTIAQKVERLELLAGRIAGEIGLNAGDQADVLRAAHLCKADLVSHMVIELPSLQGVIGREYALLTGENQAVADAIAEHYMPKAAGDATPPSRSGRLLALADRIDTLVGYLAVGTVPSGSSDPFGLRRAAHGVAQILADEPEFPSISALIDYASTAYSESIGLDVDTANVTAGLHTLLRARLASMLDDKGLTYDQVDAVLGGGQPYAMHPASIMQRAAILKSVSIRPEFSAAVQAATRLANILKSSTLPADGDPIDTSAASARSILETRRYLEAYASRINPALIQEPAEKALHAALLNTLPGVAEAVSTSDFQKVYTCLTSLVGDINDFFDQCMVNAPDLVVRANRHALVGLADTMVKTFADLTRIIVS